MRSQPRATASLWGQGVGLHGIPVLEILAVGDPLAEGRYVGPISLKGGPNDLLQHSRVHKGLVALDVDDHFAGCAAAHLGNPVCPANVRRGGEGDVAAESADSRPDAVVVRGDDHAVEPRAGDGSFIDPLQNRLSAEVGEQLTRKAPGCVARRDNS